MPSFTTETIGMCAAAMTTLCWAPQAIKILRDRDTRSISLLMQITITIGTTLWLIYGLLTANPPVILANAVTLVLLLAILAMKFRYG